ncbi:MAG: TolC family protein [Candidatus Neomarinimicrobiota bacterium]
MYNKSFFIYIVFIFNTIQAQDYTLDDCIKIAIDGKKTVLSAELSVKSASYGLKASYSGMLPSVQGMGGAGRTYFPEQENINLNFEDITLDTIRTNHFDSYSAGISLNQKIYDGGRTWNKVRQGRINLNIAHLNQRLTRIQVVQKVIASYYGLLQFQKLLDVSEKNLDMSMQQISLVKKQFDLGVVKRTDLLKAEVAQGQARVDMLNKKTSLQNARRILFNDMGLQDFGQRINAIEDEWMMSKIPSSGEILKLLKEQNPSILVSKSQIELSNISHQLIKGLRLPSLNTSLNYSANSQSSNELIQALGDDWNMGVNLSLTFPLYLGNSLSIQQQQAKLSKQQAEYSHTTLLNNLRVQAELIREALTNYSEIIPLNQSVVVSAEEDLKLVRERYSLGSATILEVLDAQVSLIRSKSNLINVVHDARIQEANLKAILGTLDLQYKPREK